VTLQVWERASTSSGSRRGRVVWVVALLLAAGLVATAVVLVVQRSAHRGAELDPGNPGREGAQALARVLDDHGVSVRVARGQAALLDGPEPDARTTVVVTSTGQLSQGTADTLLDRARGARRLVVVEPNPFVLTALRLPVAAAGGASPAAGVDAACALEGLSSGDTITPAGRSYESSASGAVECFGFGQGAAAVAVPATADRPEVVVLGDGAILRNSEVTRLDNAGVALRMLGRGDHLVWYVPSILDVSDLDTTANSEVPKAVGPLVFLSVLALLALMLWRGRRFGPLVTEPLPAVVKAIETTQSRGRLYRKARDTGRAGQALRDRSTRRLATYLGLPPSSTGAAVAAASAAAAHRDPQSVHSLLTGSGPTTEAALLTLANDLSDLEKEVRTA
jgi:Domain of unknown function (DUF4350)